MGSCASSSIPQNSNSCSKIDHIENSSMPPSPVKEKPSNVDPPISPFHNKSRISPFNSISSLRSFGGSKDEAFYDTQGWIDSDYDDDFYSVNGDFTPRSNTPVAGTPRVSKVFSPQVSRAIFDGNQHMRSASNQFRASPQVRRSFSSTIEATAAFSEDVVDTSSVSSSTTTSTSKSKRLLDLFKESMREHGNVGLTSTLPDLPPKPTTKAPSGLRYSVSSTDIPNPVNDHMSVKEKTAKFSHHCFPRLAYVRSFSVSRRPGPSKTTDDLKA